MNLILYSAARSSDGCDCFSGESHLENDLCEQSDDSDEVALARSGHDDGGSVYAGPASSSEGSASDAAYELEHPFTSHYSLYLRRNPRVTRVCYVQMLRILCFL